MIPPRSTIWTLMGGGHFVNRPELVRKLVMDGPGAIQWLNRLGVEFDKEPDGTMITTHGGGTSRKRMHAAADYSGAEIMRTLRDEVLNRNIPVVDFTAAVELILDDEGKAAGAVLLNMETGEVLVARAKTRGHRHRRRGTHALSGLSHVQPLRRDGGRPDSGLSRGREAAVSRTRFSIIPPAWPFPQQILRRAGDGEGALHGREAGQQRGRGFHVHPLETRDVNAASIIRECTDPRQGRAHAQRRPRGLAGHADD